MILFWQNHQNLRYSNNIYLKMVMMLNESKTIILRTFKSMDQVQVFFHKFLNYMIYYLSSI